MNGLVDKAVAEYVTRFGSQPEVSVFAPGRVNLIGRVCEVMFQNISILWSVNVIPNIRCTTGEHTDYNNGYVLPFALPMVTVMVGSRVEDPDAQTNVYSLNIKKEQENPLDTFTIDQNLQKGEILWSNYIKVVYNSVSMVNVIVSLDSSMWCIIVAFYLTSVDCYSLYMTCL